METMSTYQKQAEQFLKDTGTTFKAELIGHGPYFDDDKDTRDIYQITLERNGKTFSFRFGQSIANSSEKTKKPRPGETVYEYENRKLKKGLPPTAYDVLACLTKYDPEDFETFCGNFGYDTDSRKAERIYFAVQKEWAGVNRMFGDVLDQLREIQ